MAGFHLILRLELEPEYQLQGQVYHIQLVYRLVKKEIQKRLI
ncbi:hypothetical protein CLOLEP_01833 [[Clostridium] leptum DSM 753]|uniref:Uncharacterized protein n=1 Tax=[Clostridium] leptum DSM 753 TaxID=428125 RepID=A7VTE1_9FIRM|nr:hypothetical protein CLOLEP_01833 [[Clostridium] leptum DSM 753]DAO88629.1 MAG TPA: hypothetical protein [Caudoviricetes sp.]